MGSGRLRLRELDWPANLRSPREGADTMKVDWKAFNRATTPPTLYGSLRIALVVGTILNVINQGDAILGAASINWFKIALTYCVPYAVCTYGAVSAQLKR